MTPAAGALAAGALADGALADAALRDTARMPALLPGAFRAVAAGQCRAVKPAAHRVVAAIFTRHLACAPPPDQRGRPM